MGERVLRELQRDNQKRVVEGSALLFTEGGADTDRTVEKGVIHFRFPLSTLQVRYVPMSTPQFAVGIGFQYNAIVTG